MVTKYEETTLERFWKKVDKSGECWVWTASCNPDGYGKFGIGRHDWFLAHRISYEMAKGPVPEGHFVMHACDNPPCVRPDHLTVGLPVDNVRDMIAKGRARRKTKPVGLSV